MRTRLAAVLTAALAGAVLTAGGCSPAPADPPAADVPTSAAGAPARPPTPDDETAGADRASSGSRSALPDVPVRPARDQPGTPPPAPTRVVVPALDLDMPVEPEGVDADGLMALPDDALTAGWYRFGPAPASPTGTTVIAAHVDDRDGIGQFARLGDLDAGAEISVLDAAGTSHNYTVTQVEDVAKAELPLGSVFDRAGEPRLVLLTCGGEWDPQTRHYSQNVVVTAELGDG